MLMDTISVIFILIMTFLSFQQGISWLFYGSVLLFIVTVRQPSIIFIFLLIIGIMQYFNLFDYWFILLAVIVAFVLMRQPPEQAPAGGADEMYSPELMELLGGQ